MAQYWSRALSERRTEPGTWLLLGGLAATLVVIGAAAGPLAFVVILAVAAVPLAWALISFPEVTLALFVSAGTFKAEPHLQSLTGPVDPTLAFAALLLFGILLRGQISAERSPWTGELLLGLLFAALVFSSQLYSPSTDYGPEKALRFCTLTMLAFVAPLLVLTSMAQVWRFFLTLAGVGVVLAVAGVTGTEPQERLTAFGSAGTIALGRSVGVAVLILLFWIGLSNRSPGVKLAGLALTAFLLAAQLATGSRGPVFSLLPAAGMAALAGFLMVPRGGAFARRAAFGLVIVGLVAGVAVAWQAPVASDQSRERIQDFSLLSPEEDPSESVRLELWDEAMTAFEQRPVFGLGIGGLSTSGLGEKLLYPHNMVLEIASELGLVGLGLFGLLLMAVFYRLLSAMASPREATPEGLTVITIVLALLLYKLANGMVSGDLNDGRMLWMMLGVALAVQAILRFPSPARVGASTGRSTEGEGPA